MAVVELDPEEAVAERLGDLALHLDLLFLDAHTGSSQPAWVTPVASGPF